MALRRRNIFNIKSINEIRIKLKQTQDKSKNRMVYKNKTEISLVKDLVTLWETSFDKYNLFRSVQFFKM